MDWNAVQVNELLNSLREVQWNQRPRGISEFVTGFTAPQAGAKLQGRVKCNLYNFRTNYALALAAVLTAAFFRHLLSLPALGMCGLGCLCLNDSFASSVSDRILRLVRRVSPPTAQRLRALSGGYGGLGAPGRTGDVSMLGAKRKLVVAALLGLGLLLIYRASALLPLFVGLLLGWGLIALHACLKVPNLKTRLASAREEFRATFRGYQQNYQSDAFHTL